MAQQRRIISYVSDLKALACLVLMLAISASCDAAARILDEDQPPLVPSIPLPEAPAPAPVTPEETPATTPTVQPSVAATSPDEHHHPLTFFMHDILGGTHASGRVVTGIVASSNANGALPFARPNGGVFPVNGGVPIPDGAINNNNVPFLTGLGASRSSPTSFVNPNGVGAGTGTINVNGGNALPFVTAGQLPAGSTLQQLLFGTVTVIDDELTEGHEAGSRVVGRAGGFYVASSEDGTSQTMAFTAVLTEEGHHEGSEDTISFFGVHRRVSDESQLAVIGGTGKYADARGYATVKTVHQDEDEQHTTDGVDTVMEIAVYLS
ncbi:hypothetical protein H6P81_006753 [Aristolochia fimbriata]|uniref:Dirigent protein n=1 Tax=Aristolochia fimbriata TaxID=158543 RepID=A0AAV7EZJ8_ARIFI|nr:hypothetical protein H6P81_006753 [Aristolochia fimbriata]